MHHEHDSQGQWQHVHTVSDFIAYLAVYDRQHFCAHDRLWTRCWSCGHYEESLNNVDALDDFID